MREESKLVGGQGETEAAPPRSETATSAALSRVNETVARPVLVVGSLPPHGRDVDLLVYESDEARLVSAFRDGGFLRCRGNWLLFRGASACALELVPAKEWRLPETELQALFDEARPLDGLENVRAPSPHHTLLILARKLSGCRRPLQPKHRRRIEAAVASDPTAWKIAHDRAGLWNADAALGHLDALQRDRRRHHRRPRRPVRTRLVSFSGLDGAGKSLQASLLRDTLAGLGADTVVEWSPKHMLSLGFVTSPIRRLLGYGARSKTEDQLTPDLRPSSYPSALVHPWVAIMASISALSLWRVVWRHLGRGRIVIFDRYGLDFAVFLEYRHGEGRDFWFQKWLLSALSPRTAASYLLDVAPETASSRKNEQFTLEELRRQGDLLRANAGRFGVRPLDGEQRPDSLSDEVATDVWQKLMRCGGA